MRLVKIHMVKKGDTLYEIAKKHGVTVEELLKLNPGITNPDAIDVGMKVKVPSSMPKPPIGDWLHQHKVVQGDTLWKLAKAWGIQLADMIKVNPHLKNPNVLLTGEIVNIPKAAGGTGDKPAPLPEGPELHHLTGEQPIPGKTFTGPVAGLAETQPVPLPAPIPGKTPTAPMPLPTPIEPIAQPAPQPVPVPLPTPQPKPQPVQPIMEQPKPAYPAPPVQHGAVDLFKHYQVPAVEAFKPLPLPKLPEAVLGQMEMPYPGLMQPHGMHPMPCPPGTMPIGDMGGYGMPAAYPPAALHAGMYADFHADVHADLHAQAGAGAFGMGPAPWDVQGASLSPLMQPQMPMHMMPQQMPQPMPMPMEIAGAPFGMPYGMPVHGSPQPIQAGSYPTGSPCNCGCHGRNYDGYQGQGAGLAQEPVVPAAEATRAEQADSTIGTVSGEGRKEGKKASVRSTAASSGGTAQKTKKKRAPKRNPWINR